MRQIELTKKRADDARGVASAASSYVSSLEVDVAKVSANCEFSRREHAKQRNELNEQIAVVSLRTQEFHKEIEDIETHRNQLTETIRNLETQKNQLTDNIKERRQRILEQQQRERELRLRLERLDVEFSSIIAAEDALRTRTENAKILATDIESLASSLISDDDPRAAAFASDAQRSSTEHESESLTLASREVERLGLVCHTLDVCTACVEQARDGSMAQEGDAASVASDLEMRMVLKEVGRGRAKAEALCQDLLARGAPVGTGESAVRAGALGTSLHDLITRSHEKRESLVSLMPQLLREPVVTQRPTERKYSRPSPRLRKMSTGLADEDIDPFLLNGIEEALSSSARGDDSSEIPTEQLAHFIGEVPSSQQGWILDSVEEVAPLSHAVEVDASLGAAAADDNGVVGNTRPDDDASVEAACESAEACEALGVAVSGETDVNATPHHTN